MTEREMIDSIKKITSKGSNAEVRLSKDGYIVMEVIRRKAN